MKALWLCLLAISLLLSACASPQAVSPTQDIRPTQQAASTQPASPTQDISPTQQATPTQPAAQATSSVGPLPSPVPTLTPPPVVLDVRAMKGNLSNQIERLEANMPRAGSEGFVVPTGAELSAFARLVAELDAGNAQNAAAIAAEHGYELIRYTDRGESGAQSLLLRETQPIRRGWGLYLLRVGAVSEVIVEAPHPLFDERTPAVAMDAYRALNARALLIAGAHRDANRDGSADAAHNAQTVFQAIHEALTSTGTPVVLQIHGFASNKHPGYPQVVLGGDERSATSASREVDRLVQSLAEKGIRANACDDAHWRNLCGEINVQETSTGRGLFMHLELDESLRANDAALIDVLAQVFGGANPKASEPSAAGLAGFTLLEGGKP